MTESECRRQSDRYNVKMEVDLEIPSVNLSSRAETRDLSKGGICFILNTKLSTGIAMNLGLSLILGPEAQSESVKLEATVAWCVEERSGEYQIGASFDEVNEANAENIATFLEFIREGFDIVPDE
jgi:c-di-GMP-binding flagellar brake protein YcgR